MESTQRKLNSAPKGEGFSPIPRAGQQLLYCVLQENSLWVDFGTNPRWFWFFDGELGYQEKDEIREAKFNDLGQSRRNVLWFTR